MVQAPEALAGIKYKRHATKPEQSHSGYMESTAASNKIQNFSQINF